MSGRLAAKLTAGLAIGAGAVAGNRLRAFYDTLDPDTAEDERFTVATADGWNIGILRYAARGPRKPYPVVAGHGFAGTRLIWDLTPETSMARYLTEQGYDVYTVDLRGRGDSWPDGGSRSDLHWSFDDFVFHDLPTAVAAACERSGAQQAFWLGLEMSGQALYAAAISGTADRVRGAVTFGSPVLTPPSAHVPGVTTQPQMRRNGRVLFRPGARMAGPILALMRSSQLESSFRTCNTDPLPPARYLRNGIPDESTLIADQFKDWIEHGTMRSLDHTTIWSDHLGEIEMPLLVMAAAHDLQRPASATRTTFESLGSADKTWVEAGVAAGFSIDFGHDDLVAGKASRAEIFGLVGAWLDQHSEDAAAHGGQSEGEDLR